MAIYVFGGRRVIVVAHAFLKKTQRLPPAERAIALARKHRYVERQSKESP